MPTSFMLTSPLKFVDLISKPCCYWQLREEAWGYAVYEALSDYHAKTRKVALSSLSCRDSSITCNISEGIIEIPLIEVRI